MKTINNLFIPFLLIFIIAGCAENRKLTMTKSVPAAYNTLNEDDKRLADTLIKKALDNEGLFTVISGLKPVSSVSNLNLKITVVDSLNKGSRNITDISSGDYKKLLQYQRVISTLRFNDLKFVMTPYKMSDKGRRLMQINIYRQALVDSLLNANREFYGQFGFNSGVSGELLINTTEYEEKYQRFRSYGYLFGYPEHAVTFFVNASLINDDKGTFVKRNFFQIPVYSGPAGHFVYAYPKDSQPLAIDTAIKARASYALETYKKARPSFQRADGSLRAYDLLLFLLKRSGSK